CTRGSGGSWFAYW
nr:immunoglobulin heavy chain junction region [Mus musculus]